MLLLKDQKIFVFSPEPWGVNFVSKHHYALELAKNNNVWFFNPPTPVLFPSKVQTRSLNSTLNVVDFESQKGAHLLPVRLRRKSAYATVERIVKMLDVRPNVILSFNPFLFQDFEIFEGAVTVYFSVDIHDTHLEFETARGADLVLCTSNLIQDRLRKAGIDVHNIGHGVAEYFFETKKGDKVEEAQVKVGYVGNLNRDWIDLGALLKVLQSNIDVQFHFAGPNGTSNLSKSKYADLQQEVGMLPNTFFHGQMPSGELPQFLAKMDILMMCYDTSNFGDYASNPHKILEYLASGNPVVANFTSEYDFEGTPLIMVRNNSDLPELIKKTVANLEKYSSRSSKDQRIQFARQRTYKEQIKKIERLLTVG